MLKRDPNGRFLYREESFLGFFNRRRLWRFYSSKNYAQSEMEEDAYRSLLTYQQHTPLVVLTDDSSKRRWWMFRDEFYWEDEGFSATEMKALILDKVEQKEKKVQRSIARIRQDESKSSSARQPIPDDVKLFVWQRDGGRCVKCGSQQNLEFDHIIPISKGGSNTARNLQLLCEKCNRSKGANLF